MSQLPPRIRWTGSPIEVAIALGLLGPAWMECDDECDETVTNRTQNKVRPPEHRTGATGAHGAEAHPVSADG